MKELTQEEFKKRLMEAGWPEKDAEEEARKNFEGFYDDC